MSTAQDSIMGASYGSLLGPKLALAGHAVHLICLPAEADLINKKAQSCAHAGQGTRKAVEINSKKLPGTMTAGGTAGVKPLRLRPVRAGDVRSRSTARRACASCSTRVARAKVPCMSIMNMRRCPTQAHSRTRHGRLARLLDTVPVGVDGFDPR